MTDVLRQLNDASWRGLAFPITAWDFGFSQDSEKHRFIFRDEELIESLGTTNPTYRYTIPFREDIVRGPFVNLFTKAWPQFLALCLDRTKGILDDPFNGPVQCKVASLQATGDGDKRDGIDVQCDFITAPDEDFDRQDLGANLANIEGARGLQGFLDRETGKLDDATKKTLAKLNKSAEFGRLNPFDAATGAINQIEAGGNKIAAAFGDVAFRAGKLDDALRRNADPRTSPLRANARAMQLAAMDLQKQAFVGNASRNKIVRIFTVQSAIGIVALASKLGMTVRDFIKLNPSIARSPLVPVGTQVAFYGRNPSAIQLITSNPAKPTTSVLWASIASRWRSNPPARCGTGSSRTGSTRIT